jgi:biotin carboxyl carrier protein
MLNIKVNQKNEYLVEKNGALELINGELELIDIIENSNQTFHVIKNNITYNVEVVQFDKNTKEAILKINNVIYHLEAKSKLDLMIDKLGIANTLVKKQLFLKSPMPGKVLEIKVVVGQEVKQGEALLILEAMKMENVLKATSDLTISQIKVKEGNIIEKGEILLEFK